MFRLLLLSAVFFSFSTFAQSDSTLEKEKFFQRIQTDVLRTSKSIVHVYTRPFHWEKKEWVTFGVVMGGAAAASFLDEPVNKYFRRNQTTFQDHIADFGDLAGQPEYHGPSLLIFWSLGLATNNAWIRETSTMLAGSMAASGLIQTFSKEAVGRARPSKGEGHLEFVPFGGKEYHSFPSGHTMLALSSSWILARQIKPLALKIPFYAVPAIVGWSRLYDNAHWFSDIILGSALGIATAEAVIQYHTKLKKDNKQAHFLIVPRGQGVSFTYLF